jgi:hypothetical protein
VLKKQEVHHMSNGIADDKHLDRDLIEKTMNEIFPGIQMFVRDLFMPDELAAKYEPERIIMERGFTDGTNRVMGMMTPYRFTKNRRESPYPL